jgi:enamine deaminase RidA (YjgF/YER057c/UK114 family)
MVKRDMALPAGAEQRLKELGLVLPSPPTPLGAYVEAVRSGHLVFLSGMLPAVDAKPQFIGRLGGELSLEDAGSEVLASVFGADKLASRVVLGVASLPLGVPIELELVLEVELPARR